MSENDDGQNGEIYGRVRSSPVDTRRKHMGKMKIEERERKTGFDIGSVHVKVDWSSSFENKPHSLLGRRRRSLVIYSVFSNFIRSIR